jgi:hypothetical protein
MTKRKKLILYFIYRMLGLDKVGFIGSKGTGVRGGFCNLARMSRETFLGQFLSLSLRSL